MDEFDSERFEAETLEALAVINRSVPKSGVKKAAKKSPAKKRPGELPKETGEPRISENRKMALYTNAQHWLKNSSVLAIICPGLKAVERDMTKVLRHLIAVLAPLSFAKAIPIPLEPYLYAMIAIAICNFGVGTICGQQSKKKT